LYDANALRDGNKTYYYSVIEAAGSTEHKQMPLSYHQYLYGGAKALSL
jgi:hypothetical protein